ncbi:MAG: histidine kinase [Flavobacteriales bacterium]|nr:MAG: histidine kinase [Flavobacteriales bacterium]
MKHIDVEQGLPSSTVYRMLFDQKGFLWLATATGVHRYDGSRFEHIGAGSDLDHLVVHHMFATGTDTLWFSTVSGRLFRWDGHRIDEVEALRQRIRSTSIDLRIGSLVADGRGGIRFGYPSMLGGGRSDKHLQVRDDTVGVSGIHVERTPTGPLFYHSISGEVHSGQLYPIHYRGPDTAYTVPAGTLTLGGMSPRNFAVERADGSIFLICGSNLLAFEKTGCRVFHRSERTILRALFTPDGSCVVVHEDGSAVVLDDVGRPASLSLKGLQRWRISDVANDLQGGLWISTLGGGLFYAPSLDCTRPLALAELFNDGITAMCVHTDGTTWLGTNLGECLVVDARDRTLHKWQLPFEGWLREIRAFHIDPFSSAMVTTSTGGLIIYEKELQRVVRPSDPNSWYGHALLVQRPGEAYVLSSRGVVRVELENGGASRWLRTGERFSGGMRGDGDTLWLWSQDGLRWLLDGEVHDAYPEEPLLRTPVLDRAVSNGNVWLATARHGLLRLAGGAEPEQMDLGVPDVRATCLQPIGDSLLIVGSAQGLLRVDLRDGGAPVARIDRNWGLPSEIIRTIGFDGARLRVLTEQGLISVDLRAFDRTPPAQPVHILSATLGDGTALKEGMRLHHDLDRVTLRFCHLNYRDHGHQLFRYTVHGLSEVPTETREPEVNLLGLPPGHYRFAVSGREPDGTWSEPVGMSWSIAPALWQTWWFAVLASTLGALAFGLLAGWFFRQRARRAELEEQVITHHQEALLAQMDPHFIFNSLNSVQSFIARNDTDRSMRYMGRFSRLMRGLLQAGRERTITLQQEIDLLEQYCSLEALRFDPPFTYSIAAHELPTTTLMVPAYLIQPHVENAIRHGLWPLNGRPGQLSVEFSRSNDGLICTVADNGIGRSAALARSAGTEPRSEGLRIQQERIEALNRLSRKGGIRLQVDDLFDIAGAPCGTRVRISLPWVQRTEHKTIEQHEGEQR